MLHQVRPPLPVRRQHPHHRRDKRRTLYDLVYADRSPALNHDACMQLIGDIFTFVLVPT